MGQLLKHVLIDFGEKSAQMKKLSPLIESKATEIRQKNVISGQKIN